MLPPPALSRKRESCVGRSRPRGNASPEAPAARVSLVDSSLWSFLLIAIFAAHSLVEISGSLVDHSSHKTSPVCPIVAPPAVVSVPTFDIHATFSLARPLVSLPRLSRRFQRPAQRPYPAPATPTVRLPLHKAVNVSTSRPSSAAAPSALGKGTQRETKTARHFTKGKKRTIAAPLGNATVPAARSTQSATSLKAVETSMTPLTQAMPVATQKARNRHQLKSKKRSAS